MTNGAREQVIVHLLFVLESDKSRGEENRHDDVRETSDRCFYFLKPIAWPHRHWESRTSGVNFIVRKYWQILPRCSITADLRTYDFKYVLMTKRFSYFCCLCTKLRGLGREKLTLVSADDFFVATAHLIVFRRVFVSNDESSLNDCSFLSVPCSVAYETADVCFLSIPRLDRENGWWRRKELL